MRSIKKQPYIDFPQHGLSDEQYRKISKKQKILQKRRVASVADRAATTAIAYTELVDAGGNWDSSRAYPINQIIIHTTVCSAQAAANRFATINAGASAHYLVKLDGGLWHFLEEYNTAYHAGNYSVNQQSIGVEHEDNGNYNSPRPYPLYDTSAKLCADICLYYGFSADRSHIKKHSEVSLLGTACPDSLDIDRIVAQTQAILSPTPKYEQAARDAAPFVFGYGTMTSSQRLTGIVAAFKNNNIPKP